MKKILIIFGAVLLSACNFLEIDPIGQVIPHTVSDYRAMLTKAYDTYPDSRSRLSWPSDEVQALDPSNSSFTSTIMNITWRADNSAAREYDYEGYYKVIFYVNEVADKILEADTDGSNESRSQILAEALALRAYSYFELMNMYSKWYDASTASTDLSVPLTTEIDIKQEFPRATVEQVYNQIISDIELARENMEVDIQEKDYNYRFSGAALDAFEARVRLYRGEWAKALELAKAVIARESETLKLDDMNVDEFARPFADTSTEAIMALEQVFGTNIYDMDETLISSTIGDLFVTGDIRKGKYCKLYEPFMMDYSNYFYRATYSSASGYYQGKFKTRVTFRLSEMYLIAAEAAANSSDFSAARGYLTTLQANRFEAASLPDLNAVSDVDLLEEIAEERARELLLEGHRWYDLKRTTRPAIHKKVYTSYNMDWFLFEEQITWEEYDLAKDDPRYILPFPISAKNVNPYLN
ncbi:MAG: RagB/SusD family nutrient uptake outer membrane protein [Rikenellaceae bacterium]